MATDDDRKARLARVRAREAERQSAAEREAEDRELEYGELEAELEKAHGASGKDFAIVRTAHGLVAVKPREGVLYTSFRAKIEAAGEHGAIHHADQVTFVSPHVVHPDASKFEELIDRLPGVVTTCANALVTLYMGREVKRIPK